MAARSPASGSSSRLRLRPEAALLLAGALLLSAAARASNDECTDLRVTKVAGGGIDLAWTAPIIPADSYNVRRCVLPALRAGSYGTCIAEGLPGESFQEPEPAGSVFYLATATISGREGSLGDSFDGTTYTRRSAPSCASTPGPRTVTIVISLLDAAPVCGSDVRFTFPTTDVSFVSGMLSGLQDGFFGSVVENPVGTAVAIGATIQDPPPQGPGELARVTLQEGACPLPVSVYRIVQCDVVVDCATARSEAHECALEVQ